MSTWLVPLAATAIAVLVWVINRGMVRLDGDSPCYLEWCPKRTSIYPIFLDAVPANMLLGVQLFLFVIAIAVLNWALVKRGQWLLAAAASTAIMLNPYLWQLQSSIMSEALATPLLILVLTFTLDFLFSGRTRPIALAAAFAGLLAATRPAALPIVVIPVAALWLCPGGMWWAKLRLTFALLLLWAAPLGVDRAFSRMKHSENLTSLAGRHLFAKASIIDAPPVNRTHFTSLDKRAADLMERNYEIFRERLKEIDDDAVRDIVRLNFEVCIQYACTDRHLRTLGLSEAVIDKSLFKVGWARLRESPVSALALSWNEYRGLWLLHSRKTPALAKRYNSYLRASPPLPFEKELGVENQPVPPSQQKPIYQLNRLILIAIGAILPLAGLFALALYKRGSRRPLVVTTIATLVGIETTQIFAALFGVGIPRYTIALWPAIVLCLACAALAARKAFRTSDI